jgi:hypothetical protein
MTYKKVKEIKQEAIEKKDLFDESLKNLFQEMEISVNQSDIMNTCRLADYSKIDTETDRYKLVTCLDYDDGPIVEINSIFPNSLVLGALGDNLNETDKPDIFELCKTCYCRNPVLGNLITVCSANPSFAMVQDNNNYSNLTIGKIIKVYNSCVFYDEKQNKKTPGEYEISVQKKLSLQQDPTVIRKHSGTKFSATSLTRKQSSSNMNRVLHESPRNINKIHKYSLVKYY